MRPVFCIDHDVRPSQILGLAKPLEASRQGLRLPPFGHDSSDIITKKSPNQRNAPLGGNDPAWSELIDQLLVKAGQKARPILHDVPLPVAEDAGESSRENSHPSGMPCLAAITRCEPKRSIKRWSNSYQVQERFGTTYLSMLPAKPIVPPSAAPSRPVNLGLGDLVLIVTCLYTAVW